jgi:phosphoribosyl-dephospho-CoA transferase
MMMRHQLIYLHPDTTPEIVSPSSYSKAFFFLILDWIKQGLPCVFTQQPQMKEAYNVYLGVLILYDNVKYRASLCVHVRDIVEHKPLPELTLLYPELLLEKSMQFYGSYLFQFLSKKEYVHAKSDVDILVEYDNESLSFLKQNIMVLQQHVPYSVDGEIRFFGVGDVGIWELLNAKNPHVLVKTVQGPYLLERKKLHDMYPAL